MAQQFSEQFRKNHEAIYDILFNKINDNFCGNIERNTGYINIVNALSYEFERGNVVTTQAELNQLKTYFDTFLTNIEKAPPSHLKPKRLSKLKGLLTQAQGLVQSQIHTVEQQQTKPLVTNVIQQQRPSFWTPKKIALVSALTPTTAFLVLVGVEASLTMARKSATSLLESAGELNILIAALAFVASLATPIGICVAKCQERNSTYSSLI